MKLGIWGYGVDVPTFRVTIEEIHRVWQNMPIEAVRGKGTKERGVIGPDEDTITMASEAASKAISMSGISREKFGALILGTQTSPYHTRPGAAILVEALGLPCSTFAVDLQFAGKSGTSALILALAYVGSGMCEAAIAIGADTISCHVSPGDSQEYTASSGAGALVVSKGEGIATVEATASYTTDTPDVFRLDGERYIRTGGAAMTNTAVGMLNHILGAWKILNSKMEFPADSFKFMVLQQNDARSWLQVGQKIGFSKDQMTPGMIADQLGDCGAASPLISLAKVLDRAEPLEKIGVLSYGSGAGSDAIVVQTTSAVSKVLRKPTVEELLVRKKMVDYASYIKMERKYHTHERKVSTFD